MATAAETRRKGIVVLMSGKGLSEGLFQIIAVSALGKLNIASSYGFRDFNKRVVSIFGHRKNACLEFMGRQAVQSRGEANKTSPFCQQARHSVCAGAAFSTLFCTWPARVQDYFGFAQEKGFELPAQTPVSGPDHPGGLSSGRRRVTLAVGSGSASGPAMMRRNSASTASSSPCRPETSAVSGAGTRMPARERMLRALQRVVVLDFAG